MADQFFVASTSPKDLGIVESKLKDFLAANITAGKRVACVTSGGTAIPLEKRTVRFIDNFSTGTRGACCAEYLIRLGYSVIFLFRQGSVEPFISTIQKSLLSASSISLAGGKLQATLPDSATGIVAEASLGLALTNSSNYLRIPYWSLADYLFYLKAVSLSLNNAGAGGMMVAAAAVSDFYIPETAMVTHKIQSSAGPPEIALVNSPKMLGCVTGEWCPQAFIVSFKLETDESLLLQHARRAIAKYGVHLVVANELLSRYDKVILVDADSHEAVVRGEAPTLEPALAGALASAHTSFCEAQGDTTLKLQTAKQANTNAQNNTRFGVSSALAAFAAVAATVVTYQKARA